MYIISLVIVFILGGIIGFTCAALCNAAKEADERMCASISNDLENWYVVSDLLDFSNQNPDKIGFQYVDFEIEGEDIIFLCRTSINNAHDYHDANYSTFHRIENFREI